MFFEIVGDFVAGPKRIIPEGKATAVGRVTKEGGVERERQVTLWTSEMGSIARERPALLLHSHLRIEDWVPEKEPRGAHPPPVSPLFIFLNPPFIPPSLAPLLTGASRPQAPQISDA